MTEPTGGVAFLLMIVYFCVGFFNLLRSFEGSFSVKTLFHWCLTAVFLWGVLSCISYNLNKKCLPYSGALECYYEN